MLVEFSSPFSCQLIGKQPHDFHMIGWQSIQKRSSPNFKHMKGILISKLQPDLAELTGSVRSLKDELLSLGYPGCSFIKGGRILSEDDHVTIDDTVFLLPFNAKPVLQSTPAVEESQTSVATPLSVLRERRIINQEAQNADDQPLLNEAELEEEMNQQQQATALWKFASFGFRLLLLVLIFFRRNPSEITSFYALGMLAYAGYNFVPISILGGLVGSFDVHNNILTTFIGTIIPGIMDADPSKLLMEMHAAQQEQDEDEQMRMQ